jgi:foldase protein PrsA
MVLRQKRLVFCVATLLIVMMLAAAGCGGNSSSKAVAEVNGEAITRGELDSYMNILRLFMPDWEPMLGDSSRRAMMEPELLDALIENTLVRQAAVSLGIEVTEAEIQGLYGMYKVQMIQGMFGSEEDFGKKLKELNLSENDLMNFIGASVYQDKMDEYFAAKLSDEEIRQFIADNPEFGTSPAFFELSHILLETEEEAQEVRTRLLAGEDFADLAEVLSLDPRAQREGHSGFRGYLGDNIAENESGFWPELLTVAGNMQGDEISEPVETSDGWHLIKLHSRTVAQELSFEDARETAIRAMISQAANEFLDTFFAQAQVEKL